MRRAVTVWASCPLAILHLWLLAPAAVAEPLNFQVTYRPDSFTFSDMPDGFWASFSKSGSTVFTSSSSGSTKTVSFGTLNFVDNLGLSIGATANGYISISAVGRPSSGGSYWSFSSGLYGFGFGNRIYLRSGSVSQSVYFPGGHAEENLEFTPATGWVYSGSVLKMTLGTTFFLTDPSISLSCGSARINTNAPGGSVSSAVGFQVTQSAQAFVESVNINYGDGYSASLSFSQSSALKFSTSGSHSFSLGGAQDSDAFLVTSTAKGPSDNSPDDDMDARSLELTVLRSPLAQLSLEGNVFSSGSVLDVTPGQVLFFDGAPSQARSEGQVLISD